MLITGNIQIDRVISVLDSVLAKQEYIVGEKVTIADLAFIPWNVIAVDRLIPGTSVDLSKYTNFNKWHGKLIARPVVDKLFAERTALIEAQGSKTYVSPPVQEK